VANELSGRSLIGSEPSTSTGESFQAIDPTTGEAFGPEFISASSDDVQRAAELASSAFETFGRLPGTERGGFLRRIAANIEAIAPELVERTMRETALPPARLQSELARTCGQLRLFADLVEEGSWVGTRIDRADPDRKPLPKPDLRSMLRPLGPIVVFGASNFPLAFSVAGGDTASAFAAGNPVIVKAHPAHPGASELVGRVIVKSAAECGIPAGVFSLLFDKGVRVASELVRHPLIKGGGFTGSRAAGRALMDLAASRPEPIPFYAEMGSTNPVFILPHALRERSDAIATGLQASYTLGGGQFCTKPGLVFLPDGAEALTQKMQSLTESSPVYQMLTKSIQSSYSSAMKERCGNSAVQVVAEARAGKGAGLEAIPALFTTDAALYLDSELEEEIFGPTALLIQHSSHEQMLAAARSLHGHLTATIHGTPDDLVEYADLVAVLEKKVGRIIFNGFPTGVEVAPAMVHGGPYPATSDGRSTSVGTQAIFRFTRPVCYQGFPDASLPNELKDANPLGIWRMIDGKFMQGAVEKVAKS
jgi:2,5-dioxopentanoate dehydrogenase